MLWSFALAALFDAFVHGLSGSVKDQLAPLNLPEDLEALMHPP